jgi:hypothetical protein
MGNFFKDLFVGKEDSLKMLPVPQTKEAEEARKLIYQMATSEPPDVPLRQIAGIPEMGEERTLARGTAKEMISQQDIFELPEVQGIISNAIKEGNLLANRIGRSLQLGGNTSSTTGRDVLGRTVSDIESNISASLAPFAESERNRRANLIPVLESIGLTEEERQRGYSQDVLDAIYQKQLTEMGQSMDYIFPLLASTISLQPGYQPMVKSGSPSIMSQMAGPAVMAMMAGG